MLNKSTVATNNDIKHTYQIFLKTENWPVELTNKTIMHVIIGSFILFLMCVRLYLRLIIKIPPLPSQIPTQLKFLANASHFLLYFFIIGALKWTHRMVFWTENFHSYSYIFFKNSLGSYSFSYLCSIFPRRRPRKQNSSENASAQIKS